MAGAKLGWGKRPTHGAGKLRAEPSTLKTTSGASTWFGLDDFEKPTQVQKYSKIRQLWTE